MSREIMKECWQRSLDIVGGLQDCKGDTSFTVLSLAVAINYIQWTRSEENPEAVAAFLKQFSTVFRDVLKYLRPVKEKAKDVETVNAAYKELLDKFSCFYLDGKFCAVPQDGAVEWWKAHPAAKAAQYDDPYEIKKAVLECIDTEKPTVVKGYDSPFPKPGRRFPKPNGMEAKL